MKVNVVYFVNVIDEHLAKVCEEDWTFENRDLDEVRRYGDFQSDVPQTANRLRDGRYFDAAEIYEDEFAKATREDRKFQYFLDDAVELRDSIAHNLFYEGRLEHDGEFVELPEEVAAAFKMIEPETTIVDDASYFKGFDRIEMKMRKMITECWGRMSCSYGGMMIRAALYQDEEEFADFDQDLLTRVWNVNEIRNRYAHTGLLTDDEKRYCESVAHELYVSF